MTKPAGPISEDSTTLWQAICASKRGMEPALSIPDRLVHPDSWAGHLPFAAWIMAVSEPRRFVELGVHTGNSYCTFAQAVAKYQLNTECFGIDHWFGDEQAGLYGEDVYADLKSWHDPRFGHFSRLMRMSFAAGREQIEDGSVDLLHIDGLHTYEAVREDFETYLPKMSDRCIVLFHDTNVYREDFGVWQYFQEIKANYPTFEFLHSNGLGVAYTGSQPLENLDPLLVLLFNSARGDDTVATVRGYFSLLGDAHMRAVQLCDKQRWGEDILNRLHEVNLELGAVTRDRDTISAQRDAFLDERESMMPKALKWDRLAVNTGGAVSLNLEEINEALNVLYNSGNPQALQDRATLKRQFASLIQTGTMAVGYEELATRAGKRVKAKLARMLKGAPEVETDPAIEAIRASGLFDENVYALTDQARAANQDPLEHYLQTGEAQRQAPSTGFDPDYYARRNPDVDTSGFGLLRHYILFGQAEDRPCVTPAKRMSMPVLADTDQARVLLLVEPDLTAVEMSFTLNVIKQLQASKDVIVLIQPGDAQAEVFTSRNVAVVEFSDENDMEAIDRNEVLARIVAELHPEFAISLSLKSRINVRGLAAAGLGIVQLVDEFSSAVRPFGSAYEFLPWAHRLVFPSHTVAASFEAEHTYLSRRQKDIIAPAAFGSVDGQEIVADAALRSRIRPDDETDVFVVAGAGDLGPQSGIETFLALAVKAGSATKSGRQLKFVWLTSDVNSGDGNAYSRLIVEQIRRAGIEDRCQIVSSNNAAEAGIGLADAFALTAPLDAMSRFAVSAAAVGKPVFCFENGSSVADVLAVDATLKTLVSPYLDLEPMVGSIHTLADDKDAYAAHSKASADLVSSHLDLGAYVENLIRIGALAKQDAELIDNDYQLIRSTEPPAFNENVFGGSNSADKYPQDFLHTYLLRSRVSRATGSKLIPTDLRRPLAGFNPLIYFEDLMNPDSPRDPLADWLENGKKEGRWTHDVIELSGQKPAAAGIKALLHGHFFYADLIDEFLEKLQSNASTVDVIITVPDDQRADYAMQALSRVVLPGTVKVEVVRNAGRDIGPFLSGLDLNILQQYEVIGHIHGKKSPHVDASMGDTWRTFLWEHLIGGQNAAADACLAAFKADPKLGLVFPEDPHLIGWDKNFKVAQDLARKMGRMAPLPNAFDWPVGTMFWARREALKPMFDLGLDWSDYPLEPLPEDGTLLHALERVLPFAVEQAGYGYATSHLPEVQR
ncbi:MULTISPECIES: rhamnan synthesis F family protein [unclassified Roseibium]|uniref:rhamnan synthesis F family protein n=1 Tax=unclassified Roseibium TaxID=2629323 RepID=UPI00273DBF0C|nr:MULTISPECIES: rhamnan synthesis F family protein [unclassified Roseibium]